MRRNGWLAGAAGLIMSSTVAAAADLPAEPVDYVRVCDAFGAGFLYIPGSETCYQLKGRIRGDYRLYGSNAAFGGPGYYSSSGTQPGYVFRARAYFYQDTRTDTEYGLVRTYTEIWLTEDTGAPLSVFIHNAQIEFAGFKLGRTASAYDLYFGDTFNTVFKISGLGDPDFSNEIASYTATLGSGFSATLSLEDAIRRQNGILDGGTVVSQAGTKMPDIVGNLKVAQGWGSAQVMAVAHQVRALRGASSEGEMGYAVGGGLTVNLPMLGEKDRLGLQGGYASGAMKYVALRAAGPTVADGVLTAGGRLKLVDAWAIGGGGIHYWTPQLSSAIGAGYLDVDAPRPGTDFVNVDVQANLVYTPVKGLQFAAEVEWKYVDPEKGRDGRGLVGLVRVQRDF
jgi:hypothetical protein